MDKPEFCSQQRYLSRVKTKACFPDPQKLSEMLSGGLGEGQRGGEGRARGGAAKGGDGTGDVSLAFSLSDNNCLK